MITLWARISKHDTRWVLILIFPWVFLWTPADAYSLPDSILLSLTGRHERTEVLLYGPGRLSTGKSLAAGESLRIVWYAPGKLTCGVIQADRIVYRPAERLRFGDLLLPPGELTVLPNDGAIRALYHIALEDYVAGIVASELPAGSPPALLEAQSIVSRTFALHPAHRSEGFDFCTGTHCQRIFRLPDASVLAAVRKTQGIVLLDTRGSPSPVFFSAACGGRTRDAAAFFGDSLLEDIVGVPCPDAGDSYRVVLPATLELSPGITLGNLAVEESWQRGGPPPSEGERRRLWFRLDDLLPFGTVPSPNFSLTREAKGVVLSGRGMGHGVGFCQRGARVLAGEGRSSAELLRQYFPRLHLSADKH